MSFMCKAMEAILFLRIPEELLPNRKVISAEDQTTLPQKLLLGSSITFAGTGTKTHRRPTDSVPKYLKVINPVNELQSKCFPSSSLDKYIFEMTIFKIQVKL